MKLIIEIDVPLSWFKEGAQPELVFRDRLSGEILAIPQCHFRARYEDEAHH